MTVTVPENVLLSDLSATDKLIYAVHLSCPRVSKTGIAQMLKINRSTVHRAISNAEKCCTHATLGSETSEKSVAPTQHSVAPTQHSVAPVQHSVAPTQHSPEDEPKSVAPMQQSVAPVQHEITNKEITNKRNTSLGPSWKEVEKFSYQMKRPDLADEFFEHYEDAGWVTNDGEPITNWRAMFRGWCRKVKAPDEFPQRGTTPVNGDGGRRLTLEEARFIQDQSY